MLFCGIIYLSKILEGEFMDAKEVVVVIGVPNSGKSYFIKNNLKDYHVVDLLDFQEHAFDYQSVKESYDKCEQALRDACHKYEKVVLEHTLILAKRRGQYVNAIKEELGKDFPITCYYTDISLEDYIAYDNMDLIRWREKHPDTRVTNVDPEVLQKKLDMFEVPTTDDGFDKIIKIEN